MSREAVLAQGLGCHKVLPCSYGYLMMCHFLCHLDMETTIDLRCDQAFMITKRAVETGPSTISDPHRKGEG